MAWSEWMPAYHDQAPKYKATGSRLHGGYSHYGDAPGGTGAEAHNHEGPTEVAQGGPSDPTPANASYPFPYLVTKDEAAWNKAIAEGAPFEQVFGIHAGWVGNLRSTGKPPNVFYGLDGTWAHYYSYSIFHSGLAFSWDATTTKPNVPTSLQEYWTENELKAGEDYDPNRVEYEFPDQDPVVAPGSYIQLVLSRSPYYHDTAKILDDQLYIFALPEPMENWSADKSITGVLPPDIDAIKDPTGTNVYIMPLVILNLGTIISAEQGATVLGSDIGGPAEITGQTPHDVSTRSAIQTTVDLSPYIKDNRIDLLIATKSHLENIFPREKVDPNDPPQDPVVWYVCGTWNAQELCYGEAGYRRGAILGYGDPELDYTTDGTHVPGSPPLSDIEDPESLNPGWHRYEFGVPIEGMEQAKVYPMGMYNPHFFYDGWHGLGGLNTPNRLKVTEVSGGTKAYLRLSLPRVRYWVPGPGEGEVDYEDEIDNFAPGATWPATDAPVVSTAGEGTSTLLEQVREFSSKVKRPVRLTGATTIQMVDPNEEMPSDLRQSDAVEMYYASTEELKAANDKVLSTAKGSLTLSVAAGVVTNDIRMVTSGWRIPGRLPVYNLDPSPVKRVSMTFTPTEFTANVDFHLPDVPLKVRRT